MFVAEVNVIVEEADQGMCLVLSVEPYMMLGRELCTSSKFKVALQPTKTPNNRIVLARNLEDVRTLAHYGRSDGGVFNVP